MKLSDVLVHDQVGSGRVECGEVRRRQVSTEGRAAITDLMKEDAVVRPLG
jgi:hypothetical protein